MAKKTIKGLNGLRVLALLGVLIYHTFPSYLPGGFFGVVIFFVVSGFLAGVSINNELKSGNFKLGKYYLKRLKRIYPALIIVVLWSVAILMKLAPLKLANTQSEVISIIFAYNNYWQIAKNADYFANLASNSPFTHLWYISILIQFELICPIICMMYHHLNDKQNASILLLLITAILGLIMPIKSFMNGANTTALYYQSECRIFELFVGLYLGLLYSEEYVLKVKKSLAWFSTLIYILSTILIYIFANGSDLNVYHYYLNLYTIVTGFVLMVIVREDNEIYKFLDFSVTNFLSKYSFEIYLWQYPILFIACLLGLNQTLIQYLSQIMAIILLSMWLNRFLKELHKLTTK